MYIIFTTQMLGSTKKTVKSYKETQHEIFELKAAGLSSREIAAALNIGKSSVNETIARGPEYSNKGPKILFVDVENAPSVGVAFQRYNINLTPDHIIEEGGWLISGAWKWLGKPKIYSSLISPDEAVARDDYYVVEALVHRSEW
jgi:hypothetical protein